MLFSSAGDWLGTATVASVMAVVRHWKAIFVAVAVVAIGWAGYYVYRVHPPVDELLSFTVLALPILFGFSIEAVPKKVRENPYYRACVVMLGLILSALIWLQMSRATNTAKDDRESVIQETATKVSTTTATKVTETLNQQYGSVMSNLYQEISDLQTKLQGQNSLRHEELALNYVPSADLIYAGDRIQLWNRGRTNLYLWGDKYDGEPHPDMNVSPVTITPTSNYYLLADRLNAAIFSSIGRNGEGRVPFDLYISTEDKQRYTMHAVLWEVVKDGRITIHSQNHGFEKGGWFKPH
jgi:4-amino-4-deoxy-L-arabinose transferase-like glycosyltransferase